MNLSLDATNREVTFTPSTNFCISTAGNFRGGELTVLFSVNGVFLKPLEFGAHIFNQPSSRFFKSNGDAVKLKWTGEGSIAVAVSYDSQFCEILGLPTVNHEFTSLSDVQFITLTPECRRVSMVATGTDIRYEVYNVNDGPVLDVYTAHLILENERLDIRVNPNSAIRFFSPIDGVLHVTELA